MRKKNKMLGFTLIELLVVIAIIAMLMGILMPALAKVRALARRVVCGTQVKSTGTAILTYANTDEDDNFPIGYDWQNDAEWEEWRQEEGRYQATISSCLFLLVRGEYTTIDQFVCKSDGATLVKMHNYDKMRTDKPDEITDAWDFGDPLSETVKDHPAYHCSYAYQMPYPSPTIGSSYPASLESNTNVAVLADRSPYIENPDLEAGTTDIPKLTNDEIRKQNSLSHRGTGQNVLFAEGSVKFATTPLAGVENDNIYTSWRQKPLNIISHPEYHEVGYIPVYNGMAKCDPLDYEDSVLLNEEKLEE